MKIWYKILFSTSIFLGVYFILFFLFQVLSVNAVLSMIGQNSNKETERAIAHEFKLDLPTWQRCAVQLNDISPLSIHSIDTNSSIFYNTENYTGFKLIGFGKIGIYLKKIYLGRSFQSHELVTTLLWDRFKITLLLSILAIFFATIIGIGLGITSAAYQHRWQDKLILGFSSLGVSAPSFFVAILLALFFGYYWSDWTGLNFKGSLIEYNVIGEQYFNFKNLILPLIALSWRPIAIITQMTRNAMLDVLKEDYIRTAMAKGLSRRTTFWKHGLINALNPIITSISGWFGSLLAGAYFVEVIFDIKGLGALTVNSLMKFDVPVVMGASLYIAFTFILISFLVDFLYRYFDPRIQ
jgi:peptide/nickel transport system permease protein